MTDKEVFEAVQQRFTDPKIMDLLRAGLVNKDEMEDAKRALRYGDAVMRNPILRDKLYKIFDRLLTVVKDDSTTRQMVKQDLRQLQKQSGDSAMSENLDTANVEKAVKHDCAKHVVHEQWGKGQCIPGEHTLLDDGTVTHYDVMFEHGIEQNVAVEDLTVVVSESHMHAKKKRKMMETAAASLKPNPTPAPKLADVTPENGAAPAFVEKKDKPRMPLEKLKAIMEKKKSEAYKAMLRSQGKMEEEVKQVAENIEDRHGEVYSDFDDHIEKVPQEHRAALHREFERHNKMFDKAHRNDDDEHMEHALGNMRDVLDRVKKHAGAKLDEKKLTSAEMKKREEVAKAIERDQPGMPMGKKMAIATATAKKVAEELVGNQHKIDANKNNKIDAHDFKLLRAKKKTMKEFVEKLVESLSPKAE